MRKQKYGTVISFTPELLKHLLGVPQDIDLEVFQDDYKDMIYFKFKFVDQSPTLQQATPPTFTFTLNAASGSVTLHRMSEGQEYTVTRL